MGKEKADQQYRVVANYLTVPSSASYLLTCPDYRRIANRQRVLASSSTSLKPLVTDFCTAPCNRLFLLEATL